MPVTQEQLVGIIIVAVIDLPLIVISIVLMMGRGSDFIAGINTMSHREKGEVRPPGAVQVRGPVHADRGPAHADRGSRRHLRGDIHRL
ncbi:MAG: DUF3784 domain-containing protein [Lachnospiraceae bacterium]